MMEVLNHYDSRMTVPQAYVDSSMSLYALNKATEQFQTNAEIIIAYRTSENKEETVILPSTWIPLDLAEFAPKESLLNSTNFIKLVNTGLVVLIKTNVAEKFLQNNPDARAERERLRMELLKSVGVHNSKYAPPRVMSEPKEEPEQKEKGVSPKVLDLMNREDLDNDKKLNSLRTIHSILTVKDKNYIRENTSDERILKLIAQ